MTRSRLYLRAKPGRRDALLQKLDRLELALAISEQPGFLGAEVEVALDDDYSVVVIASWASPEHHALWERSPARRQLLDELETSLAAEPESQVYRVVDAVGQGALT
jgi:heme-degrading monooxygenase HmoA